MAGFMLSETNESFESEEEEEVAPWNAMMVGRVSIQLGVWALWALS